MYTLSYAVMLTSSYSYALPQWSTAISRREASKPADGSTCVLSHTVLRTSSSDGALPQLSTTISSG